eukprot:TRINITY_DN4438_c0_g2_i1.p1 TRINITY_DN4438_c0_g2~~TRINITY_DN4438_c0_g2_i1.p1  ORF type:complete len:473 (+),score=223.72 TRINITY_DN4438_c0_g2_i1:104-1522(+)
MPYKKGKRVKRRTHKISIEDEKELVDAPKSLVFCKGKVGKEVNQLMTEWRQAMMPFTAQKLKVVKRDKVKDVSELAKHFGCSTVHVFSCSPGGTHFRVLRAPNGPSMTFRVESFKLRADILKERGKSFLVSDTQSFSKPPLVVFNQLNTGANHHELIMTTFKSMFPRIHVDTFKLSHCHRVMLINYQKAHDAIEIRHYGVLARTAGVSAAAKKLARNILPKRMGNLDSVEDLFGKGGDYLSDTDGEGEEVELPQNFRKHSSGSHTRLKLTEIGPRLTLKLCKVESGFWAGETIYHSHFTKTPEEQADTAKRVKMRERLKQMRKSEQDANVAAKKAAVEEKKAKKEEDRKRKREELLRKQRGEESDDGEFEVVGEDVPEYAEGAHDGEEEGLNGAPAKKRKVTFGGAEDADADADADAAGEDANGGDAGYDEDDMGDVEDYTAPKKRTKKPLSRQRRKQLKDWKRAENAVDEA